MNYGMYIAASGASVNSARQEVFTNNLANVNTVGFRPHMMAIRARAAARVEDRLTGDSNAMLERLGAGVMPTPVKISASQGPLEQTGRPLDAAIEGDGFFVVRAAPGQEGVRVTRDGRFAINDEGRLVTSLDGAEVLGEGGRAIRLDPSRSISIRSDGTIAQDGVAVARLRIARVLDLGALRSVGNSLFSTIEGGSPQLDDRASGRVVQGSVEGSGVDEIKTLMDVTGASRAVESNIGIISMINQNMQMAISRLGRVS